MAPSSATRDPLMLSTPVARSRPYPRWLLIYGLTVASCGGASSPLPGGPTCDEVHAARQAAAEEAARIDCTQGLPQCRPSQLFYANEADCERAWVAAAFASTLIYEVDPVAFLACLRAFESASWNCATRGTALDRCMLLVRGDLTEGERCSSTTQCSEALYCDPGSPSRNTCEPAGGLGDACDAIRPCDGSQDLVCAGPSGCVEPAALGEPCPNGVCDPKDPSGLVCALFGDGVCHTLVTTQGAACYGRDTCSVGLFCGADLTCAPVLPEGAACVPTGDLSQCDRSQGLLCDPQTSRCTFAFARIGEACGSAAKQCWQSSCAADTMTCKAYTLEGQPCGAGQTPLCIPPTICDGVCKLPPHLEHPDDPCPG